jgi:Holliday junction resolvase Gen1 C-terminal domain
LRYYTNPVVSPAEKTSRLDVKGKKPDVVKLVELCTKYFEWDSLGGQARFLRSFVPGLLMWKIIHEPGSLPPDPPISEQAPSKPKAPPPARKAVGENKMTDYFKTVHSASIHTTSAAKVTSSPILPAFTPITIHSSRTHSSTDCLPELRLSYAASSILAPSFLPFTFSPSSANPLSLSQTKHARDYSPSSLPSEDEEDDTTEEEPPRLWSPDTLERIWLPEVYLMDKLPEKVSSWQDKRRVKLSPKKARPVAAVKGGMDNFVRRGGRKSPVRMSTAPTSRRSRSPVKSPVKASVKTVNSTVSSTVKPVVVKPLRTASSYLAERRWSSGSDESLPELSVALKMYGVSGGSERKERSTLVGFRESLGGTFHEVEE